MKPAIEIRNLGKQYKLADAEPYIALRDVISSGVKKILSPKRKEKEIFWALKDVDLNIMPGERVGIIGRNGAGKSTLLKIVSRITPPTTGEAIVRGRVGSLLEVGTGFHPELTGRENIYLNGSILGLKKAEINKQLDAIIDFSGVEKFIDTPLKHYSSGMQLRLAFSVAAHLEPEILLIDEVLAVGDAEFQKKCIGKMEEVSNKHGRTVLFVSHNMGSIQSLCEKAVYFDNGKIQGTGTKEAVIKQYLEGLSIGNNNSRSYGNGMISVLSCRLLANNQPVHETLLGYPVSVETKLTSKEKLLSLEIAFNIKNIYGTIATHCTTLDKQLQIQSAANETISITAAIHSLNLTPGTYSLDIFVLDNGEVCHAIENHLEFSILNSDKSLRPWGFPPHVMTYTETNWKIDRHENL